MRSIGGGRPETRDTGPSRRSRQGEVARRAGGGKKVAGRVSRVASLQTPPKAAKPPDGRGRCEASGVGDPRPETRDPLGEADKGRWPAGPEGVRRSRQGEVARRAGDGETKWRGPRWGPCTRDVGLWCVTSDRRWCSSSARGCRKRRAADRPPPSGRRPPASGSAPFRNR